MIDTSNPEAQQGAAEEFGALRPLLLGLAYRLLGSMWDAEDVVQEAYLRWMRTDRSLVREPRPFLITVVSRLALDQLRSARVTREAYPGPWLPEPVATGELGPLDTAELRDTVSLATLHLMERLSPPERAVFVLREAFEVPYEEIAAIVDASVASCRQLYHRARARVSDARDRFAPSDREHARLLAAFLEAAQTGDLGALTDLLTDDVAVWNDGGGRARAARRPVVGRDNAVSFVAGLLKRYPVGAVEIVSANGAPALWTSVGSENQLVALQVRGGRIAQIFAVLNPDKLERVHPG